MKHRNLFSGMLALIMLLACLPVSGIAMTAGTYTAAAMGNNGELTVAVTVDDANILDVAVTAHVETPNLSDAALERIPAAIVSGQTLAVDTVTGATNTSKAILAAAEAALSEAGADVAALKVAAEKAEAVHEERAVDVLVIGAGGSGMAAAITLMQEGADVLLIDKASQAGGATALTGALCAAGMSKQQAERGATDDVTTIFMDMMKYGAYKNDARLTWLYANNMGHSADWLHDFVGVEFEPVLSYFPEHTNDRALYPLGKQSGYLTSTMEDKYLSMGGELLLDTKAVSLLQENGVVTGAVCETPTGTLTITAKATILATGGYGADEALRPADQVSTLFYGASTSSGDGIKLAQEVGAMTHYMQYLKSYPQGIERPLEGGNLENGLYKANALISPLASQAVTLNNGAIYVNKSAERCMNENLDFVSIKKATMAQEGMEVYLVMNQAAYDVWKGMLPAMTDELTTPWLEQTDATARPIYRKGATLAEAAANAGLDGAALQATVDRFNAMVAAGKDDDFDRAEMSVALADDGAWYIVEQRLRMATSLGGLKTSTAFEVYNENEKAIPGLYAVGEVVGGVHGDESMPSCCVGWAITSGHLAGGIVADVVAK